jgi:hypothetical protein
MDIAAVDATNNDIKEKIFHSANIAVGRAMTVATDDATWTATSDATLAATWIATCNAIRDALEEIWT